MKMSLLSTDWRARAINVRLMSVAWLVLATLQLTSCGYLRNKAGDTSSHLLATTPSYKCYPLDAFSLCIPGIGQGKNIMVLTTLSAADLDEQLRTWMTADVAASAQPTLLSTAPSGEKAATELLTSARAKGANLYVINSYFSSFIASSFNTNANFSGPNCYDTALLASGGLLLTQMRYVGLSEFEQILAQYYDKVGSEEATFGDIVVFDAGRSREHAALFLGRGLIFEKKGFRKGFGYRIVAIDAAYDKEPGEWAPSPMSDERYDLNPAVIRAPRAFYRLKSDGPSSTATLAPGEAEMVSVIDRINDEVLRSAPNWNVARTMGIMAENMLAQMKNDFVALSKSTTPIVRLAYERLVSLNDQVFMNIDESLFSSPYAAARVKAINEENCYREDSTFLREIAGDLAGLYRPSQVLSDGEYRKIIDAMRTYDRSVCLIPFAKIIKAQLNLH